MSQSAKSQTTPFRTNEGDLASDFERLKEDLRILREDLKAVSAAKASDAQEALKEGFSTAEAQAREAMNSAASELQEIQNQAGKAVRKKPLTAVAAALAIGYFIGGIARK